jgi:hypothetical protein
MVRNLIIFSLILNTGYSSAKECDKPVTPIKEGQVAVCDGFIFSNNAESEAYKAVRLNELREKENQILSERLQNYQRASDSMAKELGRRESNQMLYNSLYFALGAVVTGVIASNINR